MSTTGERLVALSGLAGVSAMVHFLAITGGAPAVTVPAGGGAYVVVEQQRLFATTLDGKATKTTPAERRVVLPAARPSPGEGTVSDEPKNVWVVEPVRAVTVLAATAAVTVQTHQQATTVVRPAASTVHTTGD